MARPKIDKARLDVAQIFLVYISLVGDVAKTAAALDIEPAIVEGLAEQEGWITKVKRLAMMAGTGKPGDYERATNRALNFVQAHRMRMTVDAMLRAFDGLTPEEILSKFTTYDKKGCEHISGRFLADLASAAEKIHALSYAALGDSVKERVERAGDNDGEMTPDQLHAAVIAALNAPHAPRVAAQLLETERAILALPSEKLSTPRVAAQLLETERAILALPSEKLSTPSEVAKNEQDGQKEPT